jgi:hypothetical protein
MRPLRVKITPCSSSVLCIFNINAASATPYLYFSVQQSAGQV